MLTLTDITWHYQPLQMHFNLHIAPGERLAVLGPSGAGKSTLLSLTAGFLHPDSGTITIDGTQHTHTVPASRPISMLFQENNLFTHLTVRQNIGLGLHPGLKLTPEQRERLSNIAWHMGIGDLLDRLPDALSGGQRQRVALARCLVREKPLLLLDEPFSALDPALRLEMLALLESLCDRQHMTLVMVSHSLEDARRIASRSIVVAQGHIIWDGDTASLVRGESSAAGLLGIAPA